MKVQFFKQWRDANGKFYFPGLYDLNDAEMALVAPALDGKTATGLTAGSQTEIGELKDTLDSYIQTDARQTQARTEYFEEQASQIRSSFSNLERVISTPVPVGIFTKDYAASEDDQRLIYSSETDGVLTLADTPLLYKRRFVIRNSMRGGKLTVKGRFVAADGTNSIIADPVFESGEGMEGIGYFDTSAAPDAVAPPDFRMDGKLAPGVPGKFRIYAVIYDKKNYSKAELDAKFSEFEELDFETDLTVLFENKLEASV